MKKTSAVQLFTFVGESVKFYCGVRLSNECVERQRISMNAVDSLSATKQLLEEQLG